MSTYLFTSKRLGFREWKAEDIMKMSEINRDKNVMQYFPNTISLHKTMQFIERMDRIYSEFGLCYFAVEAIDTKKFIGFIGISKQEFASNFTPCWDIGWRLDQKEWGKGYATEGANRCIEYAFKTSNLDTIRAICPRLNKRSLNVITKLGMKKLGTLQHPLLTAHPDLESCLVYEVKKLESSSKQA